MTEYDNTNRGALFPTGDQELLRSGEVQFGDKKERLALIRVKTQGGKTVFEVYQKIGAVFKNNKTSDNAPDMSGKVDYAGGEHKIAGWQHRSQSGVDYTSIAITPPGESQESPPDNSTPPPSDGPNDDIPF